MNRLPVKVRLESPHVSEFSSLKRDIEAELGAADEEEGVALKGPEKTPPPQGAQGLAETLQWILEISANNPEDLLRYTLPGLREIINHYRSKNDDSQPKNDEQNKMTIIVVFDGRTIDLAETDLAALRKQIDEAVREQPRADENDEDDDEQPRTNE